MLITPGNREDRMLKAANYPVDAVVFDLEDSVPPEQKSRARDSVAAVLESLSGNPREICVRINAPDTAHGMADLRTLPFETIDSLMIPKVESASALTGLDDQLRLMNVHIGRNRPIDTIVMLETPRGILNALSIADASARTSALFFGSGDYTSAMGAIINDSTLQYPRSVVAAAAAACGLQAIDAAYFLQVKDAEATRQDALVARHFGFAGKVIFHPNQIDVVNQVFSPTEAEIRKAENLIAAYASSQALGLGTSVSDGVFVAVDLIAPAHRILRQAELIRARDRTT